MNGAAALTQAALPMHCLCSSSGRQSDKPSCAVLAYLPHGEAMQRNAGVYLENTPRIAMIWGFDWGVADMRSPWAA